MMEYLKAYKNYSRKTGQDTFIPGLGKMSLEQVFFLSLGQVVENVSSISLIVELILYFIVLL